MRRYLVALVVMTGLGCDQSKAPAAADDQLADRNAVSFDIAPLAEGRWTAKHTMDGKAATFIIELGPGKAVANQPLPDLKVGQGRLVAVAGSDASRLLEELKRALEAKRMPANVVRAASVNFTYADLGDQNGWRMIKLFFGEGENESEVFLNLNSTLRKGQFSIKDSDYGDGVLAELAKVL